MNDEQSSKRICGTNLCPTKRTLGPAKLQRSMHRKCSTKRPLAIQIKVKSILRSSESAKKSMSLPSWKGNTPSSKVNLRILRKSGSLYVYVRFPLLNSNLISLVGLPLRYAPFSKSKSTTHLHLFIDVGGGSVSNKTRHSLARISLRWMIRECFKTNTGIMFDAERLKNVGLDPQTLHPFVTPRPPSRSPGSSKIMKQPKEEKRWRFPWSKKPTAAPSTPPSEKDGLLSRPPSPFPPVASVSEEEEELLDALSPKYDQLKLKPFWWILEFIPMEYRFQVGKDNRWVSYFGYVPFHRDACVPPCILSFLYSPNKARSRIIPRQRSCGFKVHRSVKIRMEAEHEHHNPKKQKKYTPKAKFHTDPIWVD